PVGTPVRRGPRGSGRPGGAGRPRPTRRGRALGPGARTGRAGAGGAMSDSGAHAETTASPPASPVRRTGHHRRPTRGPPPLRRRGRIAVTTVAWVALAAVLVAGAFLVSERTPWRAALDRASTWILQQLATVRTPWLTDVANGINAAGLYWHLVIGAAVVLL